MRVLRLAIACVVVFGLVGCGSQKDAAMPDVIGKMPDVIGKQLDVALSDVEVLGGGPFGIIDESNWQVCEQLPAAGETVTDQPRLTVDRSCGDDAPDPEESRAAPEPDPSESDPGADAGSDVSSLPQRTRAQFLKAWNVETELDLLSLEGNDPSIPTYAIYEWDDAGGWVRVYVQENLTGEQTQLVAKQILGLTCQEIPELPGIVVRGSDGTDRNFPRSDMPLCRG